MKHLNSIKEISYKLVIGITLKKEKDIINFLKETNRHSPKKSLIVLFFDKTKDLNTFNKCKNLEKNSKKFLVKYDSKTLNLADAYFRLYKFCSSLNTEWVLSMNAGWRHNPKDISKFTRFFNKNKKCIWGYRDKSSNKSNILRKIISNTGNILGNLFLNIDHKDLTSGFYMIKKKILKRELNKINKFKSKFHFIDTELKFYLKKYSFDQIKINYKSPIKSLPLKIIIDSIKVLIILFIINLIGKKN